MYPTTRQKILSGCQAQIYCWNFMMKHAQIYFFGEALQLTEVRNISYSMYLNELLHFIMFVLQNYKIH